MLYGVATSSYQIEGGVNENGAGLSNWTVFSKKSGNVYADHNGDIACDHFHLWEKDIELMHELGIQSYRFSISWARIFPDNSGLINEDGIKFYESILQKLNEYAIEPMITLYHWDLPQWLEDQGGWSNPSIVDHFERYALTLLDRFSELCSKWITLNEPWVFLHKGLITGEHAPGIKDLQFAGKSYVNILRTHTNACSKMKLHAPNVDVGVACNVTYVAPYTDLPEDIQAAKRFESYINTLFLDPWFAGFIPNIAWDIFESELPEEWRHDATELMTINDFIGLNYYSKTTIKSDADQFLGIASAYSGLPVTAMNWEIYPKGLSHLLSWAYNRYNLPIYITENGAAFDDTITDSGEIFDVDRTKYFNEHLLELHKSLESGIPILGYYAWSFLDNFEWEEGYDKRFGIVHIDFKTLKRTVKNSGYFYRDFILNQYESVSTS